MTTADLSATVEAIRAEVATLRAERDALAAEVERLKTEGSPGVMHGPERIRHAEAIRVIAKAAKDYFGTTDPHGFARTVIDDLKAAGLLIMHAQFIVDLITDRRPLTEAEIKHGQDIWKAINTEEPR